MCVCVRECVWCEVWEVSAASMMMHDIYGQQPAKLLVLITVCRCFCEQDALYDKQMSWRVLVSTRNSCIPVLCKSKEWIGCNFNGHLCNACCNILSPLSHHHTALRMPAIAPIGFPFFLDCLLFLHFTFTKVYIAITVVPFQTSPLVAITPLERWRICLYLNQPPQCIKNLPTILITNTGRLMISPLQCQCPWVDSPRWKILLLLPFVILIIHILKHVHHFHRPLMIQWKKLLDCRRC